MMIRKFFLSVAFLLFWGLPSHADMLLLGVGSPPAAALAYTGPADCSGCETSPLVCFSLRACTAALATGTTNAIDIYCSSTAHTGIKILTNGNLDLATVESDCSGDYATFTGTVSSGALTVTNGSVVGTIATGQEFFAPGAEGCDVSSGSGLSWTLTCATLTVGSTTAFSTSSIRVTKFYDQINGDNVAQATAANYPYLNISDSSLNSGACVYTDNGIPVYFTTGTIASTNVRSFSAVAERLANLTAANQMIATTTNQMLFTSSANTAGIYGNSNTVTDTASDNHWHAFQAVVGTGTSALVNVDGVDGTGGNAGAGAASTSLNVGASPTPSQELTGCISEALGWSTASTSGNRTSEHTNQSAYFGTP